MSEKPYAGVLERWYVREFAIFKNEYVIFAILVKDELERFGGRTVIHTSGIRSTEFPISKLKQGDRIETRNSVYELGCPAKEVTTDERTNA